MVTLILLSESCERDWIFDDYTLKVKFYGTIFEGTESSYKEQLANLKFDPY